jgi:hypothetical protein
LAALDEVVDGEELDAGVSAAVGGGVEACFRGFALHGAGGVGEGDLDADLGFFAVEDADEVADFANAYVAATLDGS